ncbi:Sec-independent protein translocase subunit TatA/TatB [Lentzea jiangxiensis]|uniref:Sec-independent protein translocase protein TatA n=1 Tax=Lentzea jiangxiensis TaxID=641025 RepID=A0A1H0KQ68_9PSEU|nr:twin-arginine translocase TatA/TatE family subunit [Lentzea jiangxiensis]SDO57910.1 sec-independent protein translocase protein TatA [Lentzea jiangxiensis]
MPLGTTEILLILLVVVLLFGASRLPKLARSLSDARRELRRGGDEHDRDDGK